MLGDDGDLATKAVPKSHERIKHLESIQLIWLKLCTYFGQKMGKRRKFLDEDIKQAIDGTYT